MPTSSSRRSRREQPKYLPAILCAALCAALFLGVWLLAGDRGPGKETASAPAVPTDTPEPSVTPEPTAEPTPTPIPCLLTETEDAGQEYIDKMVFIGNSITYRMASEYTLPFSQVWVCKLGTISLANFFLNDINYYPPEDPDNPVELSLAECAARRKPEYVVITLGTHDAGVTPESEFKRIYIQIIDTIKENSPDTKIICQSIFPVVDSVVDPNEHLSNEAIATANNWVIEVAEQTGSKYLNTYEVLADENGSMKEDYAPWDGIHLVGRGFQTVFRYIRTHAWQ